MSSLLTHDQGRNTAPVTTHNAEAVANFMAIMRQQSKQATAAPKPKAEPKPFVAFVPASKAAVAKANEAKAQDKTAKPRKRRKHVGQGHWLRRDWAKLEPQVRALHGRYMSEGLSSSVLAAELGVDNSTLLVQWRKLGLEVRRTSASTMIGMDGVGGEARVREVHGLYKKHNWSTQRAGKELGVSRNVTRRLFDELNLPRNLAGASNRRVVVSEADLTAAYAAYLDGEKPVGVAKRLRLRVEVLAKNWRDLGLAYPVSPLEMNRIQALPDLRPFTFEQKRAWLQANLAQVLEAERVHSRNAVRERMGIDFYAIDRAKAAVAKAEPAPFDLSRLPQLGKRPYPERRAWVKANLELVQEALLTCSKTAVAKRLMVDADMIERAIKAAAKAEVASE